MDAPILEREKMIALPLQENAQWLWQQYLNARAARSNRGWNLVLDEFHRRWRNDMKHRQSANGPLNILQFNTRKALLEDLDAERCFR